MKWFLQLMVALLTGLQLNLGTPYVVTWTSAQDDNDIVDSEKFDCFPENRTASQADCVRQGCIWVNATDDRTPSCFYPSAYGYSSVQYQMSSTGITATVNSSSESRFHPKYPNITPLQVDVTFLANHMVRFKIYDKNDKRYEVPVPLDIPQTLAADERERLYDVSIRDEPFGIVIRRKSTGAVLFDSQLPGFTFTDKFIEISTRLPSEYLYGFGENEQTTYRHMMNRETYGLFAKDQPPEVRMNSYGVHPFYMGLEEDANAHGVFLFNSNAMDITFLPTPAVTYRLLGGILDFFVFLGPTPELVVQQYTALIGRPVLPAYWALGFQLCRYGYANDSEISDLYDDMVAAGIPYDVQYADIDYMERQMDFTIGESFKGFPNLIARMKNDHMRIIILLDPAIAGNETEPYPTFTRGLEQDVYIKFPNSNDIVWGKVWPDLPNVTVDTSVGWDEEVRLYRAYAAFPDFFRNQTTLWWKNEIKAFYNEMNITFDGLWTDMNEPASFVHGSVNGCRDTKLNDPPYMPELHEKGNKLNHKTLCMDSQQFLPDGTPVYHYDVHNLYGWSQAQSTLEALYETTGQRGIVVTRSTFPSSGKYLGHWLGDNKATWDQLAKSIIGMMEFSLFGISYTGADICGFFLETTYQMCLRWMQLGAFYPYSRNHNSIGQNRQDPVAFDATFADISKEVLNVRYTLLPYLYTLMYEAHAHGSTVVRPLLHEFTDDRNTWDIYRQFLWGPALLISPVLEENATVVEGYFPDALWYDYFDRSAISARKSNYTMPTPLEKINLHIRGGYIIPLQDPDRNTYYSRQNPMRLIAALDDSGSAQGQLFWDDGEGIETYEKGDYYLGNFKLEKNVLTITRAHAQGRHTADVLKLESITVWGVNGIQTTDVEVSIAYDTRYFPKLSTTVAKYNQDKKVLDIDLKDHSHEFFMDIDMKFEWK